MEIILYFRKISTGNEKKVDLENTIYNYSNIYSNGKEMVEILSSKKISDTEINSLGKIYFSNNRDKILKKGYINLFIDKYIIAHY